VIRIVKQLPFIAVLLSVALAFAFRVVPARDAVFTPHGVSFQEPDAWYHMRTVHNLMAHFPKRSGFDPYSVYPGGAAVVTGPFWDYLLGSVAWVAGAGSPSGDTIDRVGAWLPAILGCLLPVPVFLLSRRLFGSVAGMLSAFWVAIIPGTFLWITHLGMADHHAIETFTSFLSLTLLCTAPEMEGRRKWLFAILAGVALAAYLETRAAGVFVPAIFAVASVFSLALAPLAAAAVATCCLLMLPFGSASPWAEYTRLALIASLALTLPLALLNSLRAKRNWSRRTIYGVAAIVALGAAGCLELAFPSRIQGLARIVRIYLGGSHGSQLARQVVELQPLWKAAPGGLASLINQFGVAWAFAIPGLAILIAGVWRNRRPSVTLFTVWSLTMISGVIWQLRMGAYAGIVVAILAGVFTARLIHAIPENATALRTVTAGAVVLLALFYALPAGFAQTHPEQGPDRDWMASLEWLHRNTPEPMGNPAAWYRLWPRLTPGSEFAWPASAYSVIAQWDRGSWISGVAHRIPAANGELTGAEATSRFLVETDPQRALEAARDMNARYAVIGPGAITGQLPAIVAMAGGKIDRYSRLVFVRLEGGQKAQLRVYFPDFYSSMAARLYLFGGQRFDTAAKGVQVFLPQPEFSDSGSLLGEVNEVRNFPSAADARTWIATHPAIPAYLASSDATVSCIDLPELTWARQAFVSSDERIIGSRQPSVVKVFALRP